MGGLADMNCSVLLTIVSATFSHLIYAIEIDFDAMKRYRTEIVASDEHDALKTLEMFFDTAGLEEMFAEYGQSVSKVYEGHLERALALHKDH